MEVSKIINYIRTSMKVQDPMVTSNDSAYLSLTDEQILDFLTIALARDFPEVPSVEYITNENLYPITILTKKDLCYTLAITDAPLFDIGADNNNYLKRSQRFDHYMKLIVQLDKEYQDYLDNGGAGGNILTSHNVLLPDRYNTLYNREKGTIPAPILYLDNVGTTFVEFSWRVSLSRFKSYNIYLSDKPIIDLYSKEVITEGSEHITNIKNPHRTHFRISNLKEDTEYHVAICAEEMSGLKGYDERKFKTEVSEDAGSEYTDSIS